MKKVLYVPSPSEAVENKYTEIMFEYVGQLDDVSIFGLPKGVFSKLCLLAHAIIVNRFSFVIINWHENLMAKNGKVYFFGVIKFFFLFLVFRMSARKVIYVRHNIYPHGLSGWSKSIASYFANVAEGWSNVKVSHSPHLVGSGYCYVPHPLYVVPETDGSSMSGLCKDYFVIFGSIDRYKKIEVVLENWPPNVCLVIAGVSRDAPYLCLLKNLAKDKNVKFHSEYLPEILAQDLLIKSRGLILPHQSDEMIVSGSFFYAASVGVSIFALESPFLSWIKDVENFYGLSVYDNEKRLVESITQIIGNASTFDSSRIRFEANQLFGKASVLESWSKLLNTGVS